ncbi:MAG: hypothetical protein JXB00_00260 [Bacteroidales bacterium]|nr:hypothetical protein [Bacteroidales bacterium]
MAIIQKDSNEKEESEKKLIVLRKKEFISGIKSEIIKSIFYEDSDEKILKMFLLDSKLTSLTKFSLLVFAAEVYNDIPKSNLNSILNALFSFLINDETGELAIFLTKYLDESVKNSSVIKDNLLLFNLLLNYGKSNKNFKNYLHENVTYIEIFDFGHKMIRLNELIMNVLSHLGFNEKSILRIKDYVRRVFFVNQFVPIVKLFDNPQLNSLIESALYQQKLDSNPNRGMPLPGTTPSNYIKALQDGLLQLLSAVPLQKED